jgi:hypothetical protein
MPKHDAPIPREWRRWAAAALLDGTALVDVLATLSRQGYSEAESIRFCARLYDDPVFEAGQWVAAQLQKFRSVLLMRDQMWRLSDAAVEVNRRSGMSGQQFLEEYYSRNKPVIMTDVCDRWPARTLWSSDYLIDKVGGVGVEVMVRTDSGPDYEDNAEQHRFVVPFSEYVENVQTTSRSKALCLVADNKLLADPAARSLWDDFEIDPRFLRSSRDYGRTFMWFGAARTVSPLRHDTMNVLFNQVVGRQLFILIPSLAVHRMYNNVGVYSDVDPIAPDLDRYPLFAGADQFHFELGPGESVFLPAGWWHRVETLDTSVSISFTSFRYDNDIAWSNPTRRL